MEATEHDKKTADGKPQPWKDP